MCGVVGIVSQQPGQPGALRCADRAAAPRPGCGRHRHVERRTSCYLRKGNGLVRDVFRQRHMLRLAGNVGIGHVRYPTAGGATPIRGAAVLRQFAVRHLPWRTTAT